ncbi:MAG TPA: hypothetical protein VNV88_01575 [Candidatus Solibacter sp.]|nr:hypothetical protein [Candidatus Solibacter sp.]
MALVVFLSLTASAQDWPQWALNPQHTEFLSNTTGQPLNQNLVNLIYDQNIKAEQADPNAAGTLLVHYQVPLIDGNDTFIESKDGTYSNNTYSTQKWHQNKYTWVGSNFTKVWTFDTDWYAPGSSNDFWEPVYHAVLANGFLYDPGKGGTIFKINKTDGSVVKRINPFGTTIDPNTYTASPLSTDGHGNIFYNVVQISTAPTVSFFASDVVNSWLVKVGPDDSVTKVSYTTLLSQATIKGDAVPAGNSRCNVSFTPSELPWPPQPNANPQTTPCGTQRAALNVAPAIASDGTIYTVSKAHFVSRYNYLIAVNSNLTGKWAASMRGRLNDGCGVSFPIGNPGGANANGGCRAGATLGVDPATNEPPPARVIDDSSATPTVAPDGSIFFGAYTRYNFAQGHMLHFSANGDFLNSFNFGWDNTPAIFPHNGTYSVIFKNNHYGGPGFGSYCDDTNWCPQRSASQTLGPQQFFVTQFDPNLNIEWNFKNTNTQSCTRNADGSLTCVTDHPDGFEWCVNAAVVDANGTVYANSEDGNLYAIGQGGILLQRIFQQLAIGAAYTPASMDAKGRIYSQNDGHLFVVGK